MERISEQLGDNPYTPPLRDCPGALLVVTRYEYDQLVQGGERFATKRQDIPVDGRGGARVFCGGQVERRHVRGEYYNGLCSSCSHLETVAREEARARVESRGR